LSVVAGGAGSFAAAGVPEPASAGLLLLAALGFGVVRQTRKSVLQSR
jgi:hypothetical protein